MMAQSDEGCLREVVRVVSCPVGNEEANWLLELAGGAEWSPTCFFDAASKRSRVDVFLPPGLDEGVVIEGLKGAGRLLGLELEPVVRSLPREDWQECWKAYFHAEAVSERFVVCPTWERFDAKPGQLVVRMDPGMCFGTGQHGSTRGCLALLDWLEREHPELHGPVDENQWQVLDMGCGSGILSIGARLLGFDSVAGFDLDPDAVGVSRENAAANGVEIPFSAASVGHFKGRGRVVLANILAPVLINFARPITDACTGWLIVSGILEEQYPRVLNAYRALGFEEVRSIRIAEWRSAVLTRRGS
ncbi:MAG: 50S ribosomal protein L11 methyltransferase [Kiritimatiellia bacterium]